MEDLEQVSDGAGCFDDMDVETASVYAAVRERYFHRPEPVDGFSRLAQTLEGEIIPRLLMAYRSDLRTVARPDIEARALDAAAVDDLVRIVQCDDVSQAYSLVRAVVLGGVSLEGVFLELMSPAARRLGDLWLSDDLTFADVTLALSRLQRIMRTLASTDARGGADAGLRPGRVLLAVVPGEQHSFGVLMLEEFLRRDGWDVETRSGPSREELLAAVRRTDIAAVGLSVSVDTQLDETRALIGDIRASARNPNLAVMVGGRCFNDHPEYVGVVGADFTAVDGRQAIVHIQTFIASRSNGA
jgi:MerR family transcriptional regulator, light-induced transcriptional regulator